MGKLHETREDTRRSALGEARRLLREVNWLLLDPSSGAVDECTVRLDSAAGLLASLSTPAPGAAPDIRLRAGLEELRRETRRAAQLLESAARFHAGWARRAAESSGYTRLGRARELTAAHLVSAEG